MLLIAEGEQCLVQGVKEIPCIWHANQDLQEQYGLPTDLPKDLVSPSGSSIKLIDLLRINAILPCAMMRTSL